MGPQQDRTHPRPSLDSIYLDVPGVGSLPPAQIRVRFEANGFIAVFENLDGHNVRFCQSPLSYPIDPAASSYRVRPNRVIFSLKKQDPSKHWQTVQMAVDRVWLQLASLGRGYNGSLLVMRCHRVYF